MKQQFIIIGAGILGASTAYHLAKSGADVLVIDRQDPGQATDAAAGIICPWLSQRRNQAWYTLAKNGAAYYSTLISMLEEDGETETGYQKVGAISIHTDQKKLDQMEERAIQRRETAPEIGEITAYSELGTTNFFPPLSNEFSSIHISGAARVNGRALRNALVHATKKHGAQFVNGSAELLHMNDEIKGVRVEDREFEANCVIVTAGAWAGELLNPLGIELQVSGQKGQILHLQLDEQQTNDWPVVMPPNDQYIVPFNDGRIVVGATHEDDLEFDCKVTAGGMREVLDKALHIAPGLVDGAYVETRVGFRPFTPGFLPIIGEVPGIQGLFLANGLGASGLTMGPYLGSQLAKLVQNQTVEIDLELYKVSEAIS